MKNIYYDSKYISADDLLEYQDSLSQLACLGSSHGLNVEKLAGDNDIYSLRANKKARLLFSRKVVAGEVNYVILEILENHQYHRSRVLRGFFRIAELNQVAFKATALEAPSPALLSEQVVSFCPAKVSIYNQQALLLTDAQGGILEISLPLALQGGPGTGKTCLALEILKQSLPEVTSVDKPKRVLYLSKSKHLVDKFQSQLDLANYSEQLEFETYQSLTKSVLDGEPQTFVGQKEFSAFALGYLASKRQAGDSKQKKRKASKKSSKRKPSSQLIEKLYQEVRIISGYPSFDEYMALGKRQSLFAKDKRHNVWQLYQAYQGHLKDNHQVDCAILPLVKHAAGNQYDLIVVDEAQDLSLGQLACLQHLAKNNQICFLLDAEQRLYDVASHANYIESKLGVCLFSLEQSFRCPQNILALANSVLSYKSKVPSFQKGKIESGRSVSGLAQQGVLGWQGIDSQLPDDIASLVGTPQLAIIAEDEHKAAAQAAFPTPLIFSSAEIKGLEYPFIILYRPFDAPAYKQLNHLLRSDDKVMKVSKQMDASSIELAIKRLYVSCTRAQQGLFIFNDLDHDNELLVDQLQRQHPSCLASSLKMVASPLSSQSDWYQQIVNLYQTDNKTQALNAFGQNIKDHQQFSQWLFARHYQGVSQWLSEKCEGAELKAIYAGDKSKHQDGEPLTDLLVEPAELVEQPELQTNHLELTRAKLQQLLSAEKDSSVLAAARQLIKLEQDIVYQAMFKEERDDNSTQFEQLCQTNAFEHLFLLLKKSLEAIEKEKRKSKSKKKNKGGRKGHKNIRNKNSKNKQAVFFNLVESQWLMTLFQQCLQDDAVIKRPLSLAALLLSGLYQNIDYDFDTLKVTTPFLKKFQGDSLRGSLAIKHLAGVIATDQDEIGLEHIEQYFYGLLCQQEIEKLYQCISPMPSLTGQEKQLLAERIKFGYHSGDTAINLLLQDYRIRREISKHHDLFSLMPSSVKLALDQYLPFSDSASLALASKGFFNLPKSALFQSGLRQRFLAVFPECCKEADETWHYAFSRLQKQYVTKFLDQLRFDESLDYEKVIDAWQQIPEVIRSYKNFMLYILKQKSFTYHYQSEQFSADKELSLTAVAHATLLFNLVNEELQEDRDIILAAVSQNGLILRAASEHFKNDQVVVLKAIANNANAFHYASLNLKSDDDFVRRAIAQEGLLLQYASDQLRDNTVVVNIAIKNNVKAFLYASERLKQVKSRVLEVVAREGMMLQHVSSALRDNKKVVLAAVASDGRAIKFASYRLRYEDREIAQLYRIKGINQRSEQAIALRVEKKKEEYFGNDPQFLVDDITEYTDYMTEESGVMSDPQLGTAASFC